MNENLELKNRTERLIGMEEAPDEADIFWSLSAYVLFFIPLFSRKKKHDFVHYHLKQGFILFLVLVIVWVLSSFTTIFAIKVIIFLPVFVLWCIGIINVFLGKKNPLPLVGWIAKIL